VRGGKLSEGQFVFCFSTKISALFVCIKKIWPYSSDGPYIGMRCKIFTIDCKWSLILAIPEKYIFRPPSTKLETTRSLDLTLQLLQLIIRYLFFCLVCYKDHGPPRPTGINSFILETRARRLHRRVLLPTFSTPGTGERWLHIANTRHVK